MMTKISIFDIQDRSKSLSQYNQHIYVHTCAESSKLSLAFFNGFPASLEWQRRINIRLKIMYFIQLLYNMYSFSLFVSSVLYSEMYHMLSYYTRELIAKIGQCPGSAGLSLALCPIYTATRLGRTGLTQQLQLVFSFPRTLMRRRIFPGWLEHIPYYNWLPNKPSAGIHFFC